LKVIHTTWQHKAALHAMTGVNSDPKNVAFRFGTSHAKLREEIQYAYVRQRTLRRRNERSTPSEREWLMGIKISKLDEGGWKGREEIKFSAAVGGDGGMALTILSQLQNSFHIPFT